MNAVEVHDLALAVRRAQMIETALKGAHPEEARSLLAWTMARVGRGSGADRARQDERARRERIEASAVRDRLEKQSGRGLPRAALGLALSQITAADRAVSGDVSATLMALRKLAGRSDHPANSTMRSPNYAQGGRSRFGHEAASEIAPALRAGRVPDADGRIIGDGGDHFASGEVSDAMTALTVEDFRHMMARRLRSAFF